MAPTCAACNKPITDTVVSAMGKSWHTNCFTCTNCKKPFPGGSFKTESNKPYCDSCYNQQFGKKCSACGEIIEGAILTALNKTWHSNCFKCGKCKKPIQQMKCSEEDGQPVCKECKVPKKCAKTAKS